VAVRPPHFRLLTGARWQCYRNLLRRSGVQRANLLTSILTWLLASIGAIGSALAFGLMGFASATHSRPALLGMALFFVFALWQMAPVIFEATSPTIHFRDIARYPVTFRTFYLLHLAYGLLDPAALLGISWLLSLWVGMLFAKPVWALHAVLPFLLFGVMNLLANRFCMTLLERVLGSRKGRERVFLGLLLCSIALQVAFYAFLPRAGADGLKALVPHLLPLWTWSPPGLTAGSVAAPAAGLVIAMAALAAYGLVALLLLRWQLRLIFSGEVYSESQRVTGAVQVAPGWKLPFVSDKTSAIVEKELRYCWRESRTMLNVAMPALFAAMIAISRGAFARTMATGLKVQAGDPRMQSTFSGASIFLIAFVAYNCFGFEREGFQRWPLSSATSREILVGKNLALCLLWTVSVIAVNTVFLFAGNFSYTRFALSIVGVIYGGLAVLAAGNQFSVHIPTKVEPGSVTSKVLSQGVILGSIVLLITIAGLAWTTVWLGRRLALPWITPLGLVVLALIAAGVYIVSLNNAARYLDGHIEQIATELG
jgi:hypothetical protein